MCTRVCASFFLIQSQKCWELLQFFLQSCPCCGLSGGFPIALSLIRLLPGLLAWQQHLYGCSREMKWGRQECRAEWLPRLLAQLDKVTHAVTACVCLCVYARTHTHTHMHTHAHARTVVLQVRLRAQKHRTHKHTLTHTHTAFQFACYVSLASSICLMLDTQASTH